MLLSYKNTWTTPHSITHSAVPFNNLKQRKSLNLMLKEQLCLCQPEDEVDVFVGIKLVFDSYKMSIKHLYGH